MLAERRLASPLAAGVSERTPTRAARLYFIDTARAFAILMMLQGHFIGLSLVEAARDSANPIYRAHSYLRGLTAPLFLTVSGLVFVYFLAQAGPASRDNPRVRRGARRGLMLIGLGHLLHINVAFLYQDLRGGLALFISAHVLQVVGIGLLVLVASCWLHTRWLRPAPLSAWLSLLGAAVMAATPVVRQLDYAGVPRLVENYLVTGHGSVFTLFPWLGYMLFGGACGALAHGCTTRPGGAGRALLFCLSATMVVGGLCLRAQATVWIYRLYFACPAELDCGFLTPSHVWLSRLGLVVAFLGALMSLEPLLARRMPVWLLATGRHTLFVFVVHALILYGCITGFGIDRLVKRSLSPGEAIVGAALFIAFHVLLVQVRPLLTRRWADWAWPWRARSPRLSPVTVTSNISGQRLDR